MNTVFRALIVLVLAISFEVANAGQVELIDVEPYFALDAEGQPAEVGNLRQAVTRGAQMRGWKVVSIADNVITLEILARKKYRLAVDVLIDVGQYRVVYKDSEAMNYEVRDDTSYIHDNYYRWVSFLQRSINREIR